MKLSRAALLAAAATACVAEPQEADNNIIRPPMIMPPRDMFLIETSPGKTRWVTENEKWHLRRAGKGFMDITETRQLGVKNRGTKTAVTFPNQCVHQDEVKKLARKLDKSRVEDWLEHLSAFKTRFYKSRTGRMSGAWLQGAVTRIVQEAGASHAAVVESFPHAWGQQSIIARIPGETNKTIIVGAHHDSINVVLPAHFPAPGADDDGSGTVTIMEVLRALLRSEDVVAGKARNTIEFHWYSAEEAGLLGSQAVFQAYEDGGRDVKAMLQQDMTGYVEGTLKAGFPESMGVVSDHVDGGLTEFVKMVIDEYCDIPWVETKCGYACSDHASASKAGYPSAFVIESAFDNSNPHIHTADDTVEHLSFDHMLQHARMTLGFVYELASHDFDAEGGPSGASNSSSARAWLV